MDKDVPQGFINHLKRDLDSMKTDVASMKTDVAETKEHTAETLALVRQAWSTGTLDEAAGDLREAVTRLDSLSRAEGTGAAVKHQLDSTAKLTEKCEMITDRLDYLTKSMDARYSRTWAHPLLRLAVKTGAVAVIALAGVGMYHLWMAFN